MGTDIGPGSSKFRPNASVSSCSSEVEGSRGYSRKDGLDEGFSPRSVLRGCAVDAVEKFRRSNCGNGDRLVRPECMLKKACKTLTKCRASFSRPALQVDEDRSV